MTTSITVVGTIATEPRLLKSAAGTELCSFRLASDERRFDREQKAWVEGHTNWFGVVCFRTLAQHAAKSFKKGDRVILHGRLRMRNWEKDDRKGLAVEIDADAIGHDVRWGVSTFDKKVPAKSQEPASSNTNEASAEPLGSDTQGELSRNSQGEPSADGFTPALAA